MKKGGAQTAAQIEKDWLDGNARTSLDLSKEVVDYDAETLKPIGAKYTEFFNTHIRAALDIVGRTECLTLPTTHEEQAAYYSSTRRCASCDKFDLLPDVAATTKDNPRWLVSVVAQIKSGKSSVRIQSLADIGSYMLDMYPDVHSSFGYTAVFAALSYVVYCWTGKYQHNTSYIMLDNEELMTASLERADTLLAAGASKDLLASFPVEHLAVLFGGCIQREEAYFSGSVVTWIDGKFSKSPVEEDVDLQQRFNYRPEYLQSFRERSYLMFAYLVKTQKVITCDLETTGLDYLTSGIVSVGLGFDSHLGFYISIGHKAPRTTHNFVGQESKDLNSRVAHALSESQAKSRGLFLLDNANQSGNLRTFCRDNYSLNADIFTTTHSNDDPPNISNKYFRKMAVDCLMDKQLIYHNAKFDYSMLRCQLGLDLNTYFDTMIAHYVVRPGYDDSGRDKRNLQHVAVSELGVPGWKTDIRKCERALRSLVAAYNARDVCYTNAVAMWLYDATMEAPKLFFDIEMPLVKVLADAEIAGIRVDGTILEKYDKDLKTKMASIEANFKAIAEDVDFSISSGPQLQKLIYGKMGVIPIKKCTDRGCGREYQSAEDVCPKCGGEAETKRLTPAGKPSLDKFALKDLAKAGVEEAKQIMEWRVAQKLVTSYTNLHTKAHPLDGCLHPSYNQARTATGRLSCSNPNFQQLPKRAAKFIRTAIVPKPGYCLISADYSGQEIRILAAYSGDEKLITAYNPCYSCEHNKDEKRLSQFGKCEHEDHSFEDSRCNIVDIHSYMTKLVYPEEVPVPISQINVDGSPYEKWRTICKGVTFALQFGGGPYGIAEKNNMTFEEAVKLVDDYFDTFPSVREFIASCKHYADRYGEMPDMVGRKRRFRYAGYDDPEHSGNYRFAKTRKRVNSAGYFITFERAEADDTIIEISTDSEGQIVGRRALEGPPSQDDYSFVFANELVRNERTFLGLTEYEVRGDVNKDLRRATNHPIQGLAASMTKIGSIELWKILKSEEVDAQIVEFIHDELLVMVRKDSDTIKQVTELIRKSMEKNIRMADYCVDNPAFDWTWPEYLDMSVGITIGDSYGAQQTVETYLARLAEEETYMTSASADAASECLSDDEEE